MDSTKVAQGVMGLGCGMMMLPFSLVGLVILYILIASVFTEPDTTIAPGYDTTGQAR